MKNLIFTAADDVTFDWLKFERVNSKRDATSPAGYPSVSRRGRTVRYFVFCKTINKIIRDKPDEIDH